MSNKNDKFPYINRLIDRLTDNKKTTLNDSFTYYNRYNVNVQSGTNDFCNVTIYDNEKRNSIIADFDFDFCFSTLDITFNSWYSDTLVEQIIAAFKKIYEPTIPIKYYYIDENDKKLEW